MYINSSGKKGAFGPLIWTRDTANGAASNVTDLVYVKDPIPLLEMTWYIKSFSVNRSIEFETLHGSLLVYYSDCHGARSNLDVFDNLWCARSVQEEFRYAWTVLCILAPFSCCTDFPTGLLGHFVVACLMHGELSVTEIHCVKTLNSEFRSNSQFSACILYGRYIQEQWPP